MTHSSISPNSNFSFEVAQHEHGMRIDNFLSSHFSTCSRTFFKKLIDGQGVLLNGVPVVKPSTVVKVHDSITVQFPPEPCWEPKIIDPNIAIDIIYQNDDFLIINKPPYLSVHAPHKASTDPALVDWLIAKFRDIRNVGSYDRPGIVHRLDKNTSGLLIVSRTNYAHEQLSDMFKNRQIKKTYQAIVKGHPPAQGSISFAIARDPHNRIKMSHVHSNGRASLTHYKVLEYLDDAALVELYPVTGRTHQIRVHCAAIGHPILGDAVYGTSSKLIKRHALHAGALEFTFADKVYSFAQAPPEDFKRALNFLKSE